MPLIKDTRPVSRDVFGWTPGPFASSSGAGDFQRMDRRALEDVHIPVRGTSPRRRLQARKPRIRSVSEWCVTRPKLETTARHVDRRAHYSRLF